MDFLSPAALVLVTTALAAGLGLEIARRRQRTARARRLRRLAREAGLQFDEDIDYGVTVELDALPMFGSKDGEGHHTMRGAIEIDGEPCRVVIGDFATSNIEPDRRRRPSRERQHFSYVAVELPFDTGAISIERRVAMHRFKPGERVEFELAAFNAAYHVTGHRRFAYEVCTPEVMEFLLQHRPPELHLARGWLCITSGLGRWRPTRFRQGISILQAFAGVMPRLAKARRFDDEPANVSRRTATPAAAAATDAAPRAPRGRRPR